MFGMMKEGNKLHFMVNISTIKIYEKLYDDDKNIISHFSQEVSLSKNKKQNITTATNNVLDNFNNDKNEVFDDDNDNFELQVNTKELRWDEFYDEDEDLFIQIPVEKNVYCLRKIWNKNEQPKDKLEFVEKKNTYKTIHW